MIESPAGRRSAVPTPPAVRGAYGPFSPATRKATMGVGVHARLAASVIT